MFEDSGHSPTERPIRSPPLKIGPPMFSTVTSRVVCPIALLTLAGAASAQVTQLTHPNQFTADATLITFEDGVAPVTSQYAFLGVHFQLTNGNGCGIFDDPVPRTFGPSGGLALNNLGQGDVGMEITFDEPVQRIGFEAAQSFLREIADGAGG